MGARPRSWWELIRKYRRATGVGAIVLIVVVVIALIIVVVLSNGTGFNGYNKVTIAHTISGTNAGTVIKTEEYQPGKALWDWLQLIIIPAVLAVAGYVINLTISRSEQEATKQRAQSEREAAEKRAETEREIALDDQQEAAMQAYINEMSELLLHEKLRKSKPEDEARNIARVRTLTVLPRLDGERKRSVLQFLHESGLIEKDNAIVDLRGADLQIANLRFADLDNACLDGANLSNANLIHANLARTHLAAIRLRGANLMGTFLKDAVLRYALLEDANLSGANLSGADLIGAHVTTEQLDKARSLEGATMPDGSIYP